MYSAARYKGAGWWGESHRHALAAKGVSTRNNFAQVRVSVRRNEEIDAWIKGHEDMPKEELAGLLVEKFPGLHKQKAEEMVDRHRANGGGSWRVSVAGKLNGVRVDETQGIPITVQKGAGSNGRKFPVSTKEIKSRFNKMNPEATDGITEINFRDPHGMQKNAWAQYHRTNCRVNIFSQPYKKGEFQQVDHGLENPKEAKRYMMAYVVPHETAHHYLQHNLGLNKDPMIIEEARADALTYGENPLDVNTVHRFKQLRQQRFGSKGTI